MSQGGVLDRVDLHSGSTQLVDQDEVNVFKLGVNEALLLLLLLGNVMDNMKTPYKKCLTYFDLVSDLKGNTFQ